MPGNVNVDNGSARMAEEFVRNGGVKLNLDINSPIFDLISDFIKNTGGVMFRVSLILIGFVAIRDLFAIIWNWVNNGGKAPADKEGGKTEGMNTLDKIWRILTIVPTCIHKSNSKGSSGGTEGGGGGYIVSPVEYFKDRFILNILSIAILFIFTSNIFWEAGFRLYSFVAVVSNNLLNDKGGGLHKLENYLKQSTVKGQQNVDLNEIVNGSDSDNSGDPDGNTTVDTQQKDLTGMDVPSDLNSSSKR